MRRTIKAFIAIIFFSFLQSSIAQNILKYDKAAENKFFEAVEAFKSKNFNFAESAFENLIKLHPHQRTTASYIMLAKTYLRLNKTYESVSLLNKFIKYYKHSNYLDNAYFTLGLSYIEGENYYEAFGAFLRAVEISENKRTAERTLNRIEWIALNKLLPDKLNELINNQSNHETKLLIKILLSERLLRSGDIKKARLNLSEVLEKGKSSKYYSRAVSLAEKITRGVTLKIGVLAPLMKSQPMSLFKDIGEDVLNGIQLAVEDFNKESVGEYFIVLEIRDTEKSPIKADQGLKELAQQNEVVAVIGPVFSTEAQACAQTANSKKIPLITPTANTDGIAASGDHVFQVNPDFKNRGKAAAKYAVKESRLINLAVLSPDEPSNESMAKAFISESEKLNGNVVSVQYYKKGAVDFTEYFQKLRDVASKEAVEPIVSFSNRMSNTDKVKFVKAGVNVKLLDSLIESSGNIGVNILFGRYGRKIADSLGVKYIFPDTKASDLDLPVNSIHGIFLPISSPDEIHILVSQLSYYNIKAQILGTSEWYNISELQKSSLYTTDVIILSEIFLDPKSTLLSNFEIKYYNRFRKNYSRNSLFGYDAARLILSRVSKGATTREKIRELLSIVEDYQGVKSKITLRDGRVNNEFNILKFKDGKIIKIGAIRTD